MWCVCEWERLARSFTKFKWKGRSDKRRWNTFHFSERIPVIIYWRFIPRNEEQKKQIDCEEVLIRGTKGTLSRRENLSSCCFNIFYCLHCYRRVMCPWIFWAKKVNSERAELWWNKVNEIIAASFDLSAAITFAERALIGIHFATATSDSVCFDNRAR